MDASYTVTIDLPRNLVRVTLRGFFTPADIRSFLIRRNAAHAQLTCAPNEHLTLTDVREMKIQSQEIVDAFRVMLADRKHQSRKVAFVTASSLARLQLIRAAESRIAKLFSDMDEAEAWLMASEPGQPLAPGMRTLAITR